MKINIHFIISISAVFAYSMETTHTFNIASYGTKIMLTKESLFDAADKVNLVVIGNIEQTRLKMKCSSNFIQSRIHHNENIIFKKNNDSDSDDDSYKAFDHPSKRNLTKNNKQKTITCISISITEPCITQNIHNSMAYQYQFTKKLPSSSYKGFTFYSNEALKEASQALAFCYKKALTTGLKKLINTPHEKSIALPTLGGDVGVPREVAAPIAISAVLEFIKNNPKGYERINFFVHKRADFKRYKDLLLDHYRAVQKAYLLYYGDTSIINFALLPREIQNIILLFMLMA